MAIRFGSGSLQFELVEGWEQHPEGWSHADVAGVCTDSNGNVFLYCRGDHPVMIYDREGRFLDSWGEGLFSYRTHGMFMGDGDEMFLVDDGGNSVGRYSPDGKLLQQIGPAGMLSDTGYDGRNVTSITHGGEPFNRPTNLAVAPSGDLYVSDGYGNCRIHRFSADGRAPGVMGRARARDRGSSTCPTAHGSTPTAGCSWPTVKTTASRSSARPASTSASGSTCSRPQDIFIDDGLVYVGELLYRKGDVSLRRGPILEEEPTRLSIYDLEGNCCCDGATPTRPRTAISSLPTGSGSTTRDPSTWPRSPTPSCPGWVWACRRPTPSRSSPEPDIGSCGGSSPARLVRWRPLTHPGRDEGRWGGDMVDRGMLDLTNEVAVITGAAAGMGRAIAARMSEAGAQVVAVDVDPETPSVVEASLPGAAYVVADVSLPDGHEQIVADSVAAIWAADDPGQRRGHLPESDEP